MWNEAFVKRDMGVLTAPSSVRSAYSEVKMEKAIRSQVDRILLSCGSPGGTGYTALVVKSSGVRLGTS